MKDERGMATTSPFSDAPALIVGFYTWAKSLQEAIGRPLKRADLSLDRVYRWAPNMKVLERTSKGGPLYVRLFGTMFAEFYGVDLTGRFLSEAFPKNVEPIVTAGYNLAEDGWVVYEKIGFTWESRKNVDYRRLIYPLETSGRFSIYAIIGFRSPDERVLADRGFETKVETFKIDRIYI